MRSNKFIIGLYFVIFSLPIPFSILSWIGTIMAFAATGMTDWSEPGMLLLGFTTFSAYILAGTYLISYIISLSVTIKEKAFTFTSFYPPFHICLTLLFFLFSIVIGRVYNIQ